MSKIELTTLDYNPVHEKTKNRFMHPKWQTKFPMKT